MQQSLTNISCVNPLLFSFWWKGICKLYTHSNNKKLLHVLEVIREAVFLDLVPNNLPPYWPENIYSASDLMYNDLTDDLEGKG